MQSGDDGYLPRLIDPLLDQLLRALPAVFLTGPRAVGKTTTASRWAASVVRLDDPGLMSVWSTSPDTLLARLPEPVLLDEWQNVPAVIGAVKRAVDADSRPGRFIITGSASADTAPAVWPGVGRLVRVPMWGLTAAEAAVSVVTPFVERLANGHEWSPVGAGRGLPTLPDYVELAVRGQFPAARDLPPAVGLRWAQAYVEDLVTRDVPVVGGARNPALMRSFLRACAELSATVSTTQTYLEVAGVNRGTATSYQSVLAGLGIIDVLPAWHDHRIKRLTRTPKRVVADTSLLAALLGVGVDSVLADGLLLGRMLESFVIAQLRPEVAVSDRPIVMHHLRSEEGRHEVDILLDLGAGRVAGIEVKATAAPRPADIRHLAWLRDELGPRFAGGVVLHTGPSAFPMGERIWALPIAAMWSTLE